jgi:hypothetical protein
VSSQSSIQSSRHINAAFFAIVFDFAASELRPLSHRER